MDHTDSISILLDTDIGNDIDDALCLTYLLSQPRCDLVGITTVRSDPISRAKLAEAICRVHGRTNIPIHAGYGDPLVIDPNRGGVPQAEVLSRWPHRREIPPHSAVWFMRDLIRSRPGEITLLAIGPLTNVALLFLLDPEIPSLLKSFVTMVGGFAFQHYGVSYVSEANARLDPHAASVVFRSKGVMPDIVNLDVTMQCQIPSARLHEALETPKMAIVKEMLSVWATQRDIVTFHDPLAAAAIFRPELLRYEHGTVNVEISSNNPNVRGMTLWDAKRPEHRRAVWVDVDAFFAEFFSVVGEELINVV